MSKMAGQSTDAENAKFVTKSVSRDNDLKVNGRGGIQDIASEDPRDTQTGKRQAAADIRSAAVSQFSHGCSYEQA